MNAAEILREARAMAARLDPAAFAERLEELERGGLKSPSLDGGSAAAEKPLPCDEGKIHYDADGNVISVRVGGGPRDIEDRHIRRARQVYETNIQAALGLFDECFRLERSWIPPDEQKEPVRYRKWREDMEKDAKDQVSPRAEECANKNCRRIVERTAADPLRMGRCTPCAAYKKRTGSERPKDLIDDELGRRAG